MIEHTFIMDFEEELRGYVSFVSSSWQKETKIKRETKWALGLREILKSEVTFMKGLNSRRQHCVYELNAFTFYTLSQRQYISMTMYLFHI